MTRIEKQYDAVIVGGGMSGMIAALAAARKGATCALIQNRPVLGGNASSEIRMHIVGADRHGKRANARETGILEEILLENKKRNPYHSYAIFDSILWEKAEFQDNLDLYLNTHFTDVTVEADKIIALEAVQLTTETTFKFLAQAFVDATGDGSLAAQVGAEFMMGREGRHVFSEPHAPETSDTICMGSTLLFNTIKRPHPVPFIKPFWANTYTEADLKGREHGSHGHNYWWIELGGDDLDTISDSETIRNHLLKALYGVWDHIKNGGQHDAECYDLDWVGFLPGKRESRRIVGDYILTENDLMASTCFEDAVAYGGWAMDMHIPGGLKTRLEPTEYIHLPDVYTIPYRSLYAKDFSNLWLAGRIISTSHMAFGSTRVMGTCAVVGQAVGTAIGVLKQTQRPMDVRAVPMAALQQALLLEDAYIPGIPFKQDKDLAPLAQITASDALPDCPATHVVNGHLRAYANLTNRWAAPCLGNQQPTLTFTYDHPVTIGYVDMKLDSNLSRQLSISMFHNGLKDDTGALPDTLIRDYTLTFMKDTALVHEMVVTDNHLRHQKLVLPQTVHCDQVQIQVKRTYGCQEARIYAVSFFEDMPY